MKIDGHPFATNMVDVARDKGSSHSKILTSSSAKKSRAVDPKAQIVANEVKGKGPMEDVGRSSAPHRHVTSQMLLNKFQRDRERRQRREEEEQCKQDHWRCPFFVYCWEKGLTLPSAYDCPECNGQGSRSYERPVRDRLGGRSMLRDPARRRVPAHDRLEQMADDRVQDDQPMRRDPEREPDRTNQSQWCPGGLTRSQKRHVQRLHQLEIIEE